jgi:hypothetical protein
MSGQRAKYQPALRFNYFKEIYKHQVSQKKQEASHELKAEAGSETQMPKNQRNLSKL